MNYLDQTVGNIVADNFATSEVFSKYQIDFCCGGDQLLSKIIEEQSINTEQLLHDLQNIQTHQQSNNFNFKEWSLELQVDYITKYHHAKIREKGPDLLKLCEKVANVHGSSHPELIEVAHLYRASLNDLLNHLMKEDTVLFPFIYQMIQNGESAKNSACFGSIEMPISVMMHEHDQEGERFKKISQLTNHYAIPEDACKSYTAMMKQLQQFEKDLHEHIHIENNIVFPDAIRMAKSL
ncbi:iron-sulfur cluster repair di-iron protein [Wohlfahrtiimonas larvae]|uniref:Iron-sulfur cluster repair di-iron protein n=2 Tax=Wohlfahrtiimonas larvae TaxID=1157986 RepID=A0ABP9MG90_9GAMM